MNYQSTVTTSTSSSYFRAQARDTLRGNWSNPVIVTLIHLLIIGAISKYIPFGSLIITGAFSYGIAHFFLNLIDKKAEIADLFEGFKNGQFSRTLGAYLLVTLYTFLWSLLFIIPGIIKAYSYSMTFYILRDNPNISVADAITRSRNIMDGRKWDLFVLHLSFIGWAFLCILTLGIGSLWLTPYIQTATTHFYRSLIPLKNNEETAKIEQLNSGLDIIEDLN